MAPPPEASTPTTVAEMEERFLSSVAGEREDTVMADAEAHTNSDTISATSTESK